MNRSSIRLLTWDAGYEAALNDNNTILFSMGRLAQRESMFKWVGPNSPTNVVLFAMKEKAIQIESPDDLKKYRIGVIDDSAEQLLAVNAGLAPKDLVVEKNPDVIIKLLDKIT